MECVHDVMKVTVAKISYTHIHIYLNVIITVGNITSKQPDKAWNQIEVQ